MRGRFIVIEGLDGVGKSTLVQGLVEALGAVHMSTPGEALADVRVVVDELVEGCPEASQLFYACSVLAMGARAVRAVQAGQTVVMDRYWLTTATYARVYGSPLALEEVERCVPAPDLTLYLSLNEAERRARMEARGKNANDERTLAPDARIQLDRTYRELLGSRLAGEGRVLDLTGLDPEQAVAAALAVIEQRAAA